MDVLLLILIVIVCLLAGYAFGSFGIGKVHDRLDAVLRRLERFDERR